LTSAQVPGFKDCIPVQCAFCLRTNAFTPNSAGDYECVVCHEITHIESLDSKSSFHVGVTPLHACLSLREHAEVAELLLDQGADICATNGRGDTALHVAATAGFARVAAILLARGAAVEAVCPGDGDTPLHRAAAAGHAEVVRLLVAAGANVAAKNAQGKSVRQLADQCRSTAVIAALTPSAV
jgi:ankyrin repeat protein